MKNCFLLKIKNNNNSHEFVFVFYIVNDKVEFSNFCN